MQSKCQAQAQRCEQLEEQVQSMMKNVAEQVPGPARRRCTWHAAFSYHNPLRNLTPGPAENRYILPSRLFQRKASMAALQAVDETNSERESLKTEVKQLKLSLDAASKDAAASKASLARLHGDSSKVVDDASKLRARVAQLESDIRDRESKETIEARSERPR